MIATLKDREAVAYDYMTATKSESNIREAVALIREAESHKNAGRDWFDPACEAWRVNVYYGRSFSSAGWDGVMEFIAKNEIPECLFMSQTELRAYLGTF